MKNHISQTVVWSIVFVAALSLCTTTLAQGKANKVKFLKPAEALKKMTFPDGFKVTAFAAEPDVVQPFAFKFDDRGRMWVLENLNYQSRRSDTFKQGPQGRIIILEDTDGDGRFDKKKTFLDKIFFPTGLELGFGGVWVGSPPNLLFIPDRDRDDKPDGKPQVVLDGWGRNDRHETLNSFLWGPDGWLYGCHGIFTHSKVGTPNAADKDRQKINGGIWRYHPVKKKFEVFAWGLSNPWGLDFDDHGQMFATACVIPHLWHVIQGGRYHRQSGRHFNRHVYGDIKTIADHRHKSAHGGARFYLADAFPKKYQKRLFMCNIHEHAMLTDVLERKGSGFSGRHGDSFLKANDPQFLGFSLEIGPEGAVYALDWHDADICGKKVVFGETGRIWRIAYQGTKTPKKFDLAKLSDAELVQMHLHANDWYVRQARRILYDRTVAGKLASDTHKKLLKILNENPEAPRKLRALWSLHVTGGLSEELLLKLLDNPHEYVRAWAIQLEMEDKQASAATLKKFAKMARDDSSAVVRLYLASALQRLELEDRWSIAENLIAHEQDAKDHNLPLIIWYGVEPMVAQDKTRAITMAAKSKISLVRKYIARRAASSVASTKKTQKKAG